MFLLYLFSILNFLCFCYLIFLFFKKNKTSSKNNISSESIPNQAGLKIGLTRYNPFEDLGGDQSFILCLLDQNNSGVIITSLHNRDLTRVYAKPIKNGEGENFSLSKDEKSAILKTIKS